MTGCISGEQPSPAGKECPVSFYFGSFMIQSRHILGSVLILPASTGLKLVRIFHREESGMLRVPSQPHTSVISEGSPGFAVLWRDEPKLQFGSVLSSKWR